MNLTGKFKENDIKKLTHDAGYLLMRAFNDDEIIEMFLNPDKTLWENHRKTGMKQIGEMNELKARSFIYQISGMHNLKINEGRPFLECELPFDRARFEGTIPPITDNPTFTIRKHAKKIYTLNDYVNDKIMSKKYSKALYQAIKDKKSILICGAPGTGKTTLANALVDALSEIINTSKLNSNERVIVLEDVPELQCRVNNLVSMRTSETMDMNKLLKITLRYSPGRILVGEVRDKAMLELLKSFNVGCSGIATVHSNTATPDAAVQRCMDLALEACVAPPISLISETIGVVVTINLIDKAPGRKVNSVSFLDGYDRINEKFIFTKI